MSNNWKCKIGWHSWINQLDQDKTLHGDPDELYRLLYVFWRKCERCNRKEKAIVGIRYSGQEDVMMWQERDAPCDL